MVGRARVVIGAHGHNSRVVRAVNAERYQEKPVLENAFYTLWRDLPVDAFTTVMRGDRAFVAVPTYDDLTLLLVGWPFAHASAFRCDVEGSYFDWRRSCRRRPSCESSSAPWPATEPRWTRSSA